MAPTGEHAKASDGLPARLAPSWTEEKLRILSCYIQAFARACRSAGGWYGIDLFAGGGLNISKTNGGEIWGSPMRMLQTPMPLATEIIAAEQDPRLAAALRSRTEDYGERIHVIQGDGVAEIGAILQRVERRAPAFAFLDPEGVDLAWTVVEAIARHKPPGAKKVEQLILLPTDTGFVRLLWLKKKLESAHVASIDAMFGNQKWRLIFQERRAGRISAAEARDAYVKLYARGLHELGYLHVQDRRIEGDRGQPMYFLIFASDHPAGDQIMAHCFDKRHLRVQEELGQQTLFAPRVAPRRRTV